MLSLHQQTIPFNGDAFDIFYLFKDRPQVFFLDSSLQQARPQFSYIGFSPFKIAKGGDLASLKKAFHRYRLKPQKVSFPAGAVGYLGYDGSLFFGFYDTILAVDHRNQQLIISSFFRSKIKDILDHLNGSPAAKAGSGSAKRAIDNHRLDFKSNFSKAQYLKMVRKALEHIRCGDIYQINLSHQITLDILNWQKSIHPADIYRNLRRSFPSQFGAYFHDGRQIILSASPERFLKFSDGIAQVKPMKGTRPRGKTRSEDQNFKEQLLKSPKEIAELLMVTDLERNDLGRVCDYASVKVTCMRAIETYKAVFQATATVEGRLHKNFDQFDLLKAVFPSGSVTGCPKIEAMKIIKKLEHSSRRLYTGALGYMSFSGDMDFNVMIRTMFLSRSRITFHVGGGIVADSKPYEEWQETWDKAMPLMDTLKRSFA